MVVTVHGNGIFFCRLKFYFAYTLWHGFKLIKNYFGELLEIPFKT